MKSLDTNHRGSSWLPSSFFPLLHMPLIFSWLQDETDGVLLSSRVRFGGPKGGLRYRLLALYCDGWLTPRSLDGIGRPSNNDHLNSSLRSALLMQLRGVSLSPQEWEDAQLSLGSTPVEWKEVSQGQRTLIWRHLARPDSLEIVGDGEW